MARLINRLTQSFVASVTTPGFYADGNNLHLLIKDTGGRSWVFRTRKLGGFDLGLGSAATVRLKTARRLAADVHDLIARGLDPRLTRRRERAGRVSFGTCVDAVIDSLRPSWKDGGKSEQQWTNSLSTYAAELRSRPVGAIDVDDVAKVLRPIWTEKQKTAERVRGRIERVFDYASAMGFREGSNPARWKGNLDHILGKPQRGAVKNHEAMPYKEVADFMRELEARDGFDAAALRLTILTGARSAEALRATWDEIDIEQEIWTVPAGRMKGGVEHLVPLTPAAIDLLHSLPRIEGNQHLFPGRRHGQPLGNSAMLKLIYDMGRRGITAHGFRSSLRDWCGNETSFPREIAEEVLSHAIGDQTERAYRRQAALGKRRKLLEAWAAYVSGRKGAVVPLRRENNLVELPAR